MIKETAYETACYEESVHQWRVGEVYSVAAIKTALQSPFGIVLSYI